MIGCCRRSWTPRLARGAAVGVMCLCGLLSTTALAKGAGFEVRQIPKEEIRSISASSTSDGMLGGQPAYRAIAAIDGVAWSAWGEGSIGDGTGESIRVDLGGTRYLTRVGLVNGNSRDFKQWRAHGRAKTVKLRFRLVERDFSVEDKQEMQYLDLGAPIETDFAEVVITSVYPGATDPTCFSEIALFEPTNVLELRPAIKEKIEAAVRDLRNPERADIGARALGEVGAPAIPWLVGLKADPSPETRRTVATILGQTASPAAGGVLVEIYESSPEREVRSAVLDALKGLHATDAVPFLTKVAEGEDAVFARKALLAMEGLGDKQTLKVFLRAVLHGDDAKAGVAIRHLEGFGDEAIKALKPYLRDRSDAVKARAVWATGRASGEKAYGALMKFINGGEPVIVLAALRGLGETRTPEAFDILAANADHDMPDLRAAVAGALGNFQTKAAAGLLGKIIRTDKEQSVREEAWRALTVAGRPGVAELKDFVEKGTPAQREEAFERLVLTPGTPALAALIDLMGDRRHDLKQRAIAALKERSDGGDKAIVQALGHEDSAVRFAVARYLASLGRRVVPSLLPIAMSAEDPALRVAALRVLGEVGDPRGVTALLKGMRDEQKEVRRAAVQAAARLPSKRYGDVLVALLDDPDDDVRLGAIEALGTGKYKAATPTLVDRLAAGDRNSIRIIWALGEMRDQAAVDVLAKQYRSKEAFTRQVTIEALGKIGGSQAMTVMMDAMTDPDRSVRRKAEGALAR